MSPSRRIMHVASVRWNSAIAEYAISSCRANLLSNHKVSMVVLDDSPLQNRIENLAIQKYVLNNFSIAQVFQARKYLQEFKPDLIITHGGPETVLFGIAAAGKTPIIRVRGYGFEDSAQLSRYLYDLGQLGVVQTVTPSEKLMNQIKAFSKIKVESIPIGIDSERFKFIEKKWNERKYADLLIFGRLDPVKGHREFISIFSVIKASWNRYRNSDRAIRLRIVGTPANLSNTHLEKQVEDAGLKLHEDVVIQNDKVEEVSGLMSETTCGVVSSIGSEVICRVAEEFVLSGTPVVVSGVGSLNEVLQSPIFGISYEGFDTEQAALQIVKHVAACDGESAEVRISRMDLARRYFDISKMSESWENLFKNI